jgi:hypothetical protein
MVAGKPIRTYPPVYRVSQEPHPFYPDSMGTQCTVTGCWGWVDDYRHLTRDCKPRDFHQKPVPADPGRSYRNRMG